MTYCVAMTVPEGLVFVSDSRTNAGVDQLGTYSKMHQLLCNGERTFVLLSSGNALGVTLKDTQRHRVRPPSSASR